MLVFWFLIFLTHILCKVDSVEFNMTEYYEMPSLYDFDDYDRCLQQYNNLSTYCFVRADILPNNSSTIWRTIKDVTQDTKHHFDHSHLYFGLCIRECEQALAQLGSNVTDELFAGILTRNEKVNSYLKLFSAEDGNREQYNQIVNQCINLRLKGKYALRAESVIEYCDTTGKVIEEDAWNMTYYAIICMLALLTTFCTFFDLYLKHKRRDKLLTDRDHYKAPLAGLANNACVVFSMARNWYRLTQEPTGKIGRELRFLDCFKFFSMFLVIFAHTNWILYEGAITNPEDPERLLHTTAGTLLLSGALIVVTFFVIGGLLLSINWIAAIRGKNEISTLEYVWLFIKFNAFRYVRLTIPYAFVLLISGVYFENPGGPLWRHIFEREQLACRKNWWTNLLYVNNFVNTNERCMLQAWYLAADTQSFMISLVFLMIATKWPKVRTYLFSTIIAICMLIPAIFVYVNDFDAMFIPSPQTQRDSFIDDRSFTEFYTPFYMNFGCYFFGVIAALVYDEISSRQFKLRQYKSFKILWFALIPVGVSVLFSSHPVLQYAELERPALIWRCIYAAIQRNIWGFGLSIFIIGMTAKVGWIIRKFACLPIFRILGRLTYGAFILHLLVGRIVVGTLRQPLYFGTGMMFTFVIFNVAASYFFSLILAIFVELPVSSFLKLLR